MFNDQLPIPSLGEAGCIVQGETLFNFNLIEICLLVLNKP